MTVMRNLKRHLLGGLCLAAVGGTPALVQGQELPQTTDFEIRRLNDVVDVQRQQIEQQQQALEQQQQRLEALERAILAGAPTQRARYTPAVTAPAYPAERRTIEAAAQPQAAQTAQAGTEQPVGEPPSAEEVLREIEDIAGLREAGGVLTRPGTLVFEPSIEYEQTGTNRFFFNGVQIAETVLVGNIEVTDADRDSVTAVAAFRTGITNRSEVEIRVPYVYRDDIVTQQQIGAPAGSATTANLSNSNIGDVEISGRYQLNDGADGLPIFIGNLRVKTPTGEGPFDISRDVNGIETELSTGSGFWAVEPGVTWIFPSDPAVFYGKLSYLWNVEQDVDENIGGTQFDKVDPGDVLGLSFGMGFALNERTSFSIGYQHNFIFSTVQETSAGRLKSEEFDVGTLNFGYSYALTPDTSLNLSFQTGVTEDAPDIRMVLRVPMSFDIF